jgi:dihydropteroate synthase
LGRTLTFGLRTLVMGVINVTPDSFYAGSRVEEQGAAIEKAIAFAEAGADIVDIGGMSTRPGAREISPAEEAARVIPVIEGVRRRSGVIISVDTYRPEVAQKALSRGAEIVNDVSGLGFDHGLAAVVRKGGGYIVLMHTRGKPERMQQNAVYADVVQEVSDELDISIARALEAGIGREKIILDPGIGFAKKAEHNLALLKHLPSLRAKGYPLLVGLSRKSFLGSITGLPPEDRLLPTVAANAITIFQGADIIRVHDVREAVITAKVAEAIKKA